MSFFSFSWYLCRLAQGFRKKCSNTKHAEWSACTSDDKLMDLRHTPKTAIDVFRSLGTEYWRSQRFCQGCIKHAINMTPAERRQLGLPPERGPLNPPVSCKVLFHCTHRKLHRSLLLFVTQKYVRLLAQRLIGF